MASMGGGPLDPEPLLRLVKGAPMLLKYLTSICKAEGLQSTGVKATLQGRISDNIRSYTAKNDIAGYNRLKAMLEHPDQIPHVQGNTRHGLYSTAANNSSPQGLENGYSIAARSYPHPFQGALNTQLKPTPFYSIVEQLGETKACEIMENHRHTVGLQIKPGDYPILNHVQMDKNLRVMVFSCEYDAPLQGKREIAFPHQSEIKVNGGEVKANLRGLKNKPGSTRPVDITDALRLRQMTYHNNVEMTYALTTKASEIQKYYLFVNVVRTVQVSDLVGKLEMGKRISRDSVINEMITKARDPDVVATSSILSLKCPLSYSRISLPCRSVSCRHNQCFDGTSYLQLQEQGPTWLCPICSIPAPYETLAVDEYVRNILANTSKLVEQVAIEPDGRWSQNVKTETPNGSNANFGSDNDDLVEIKDSGAAVPKIVTAPVLSTQSTTTPPVPSREASASLATSHASASNNKRTISQVIDLTLSDDEEDDSPISRPLKRQFNSYSTIQGGFAAHNGTNCL